jgi:hypothetical protein
MNITKCVKKYLKIMTKLLVVLPVVDVAIQQNDDILWKSWWWPFWLLFPFVFPKAAKQKNEYHMNSLNKLW